MAWMRALAVVSIVTGIVLGLVGLEPMRALRRLLGKTVAWMAASSLLAVVVAMWVALGLSTRFPAQEFARPAGFGGFNHDEHLVSTLTWGWLGLVGLCLGIGYYRNQIEEGHAKLLSRFCQGLESILDPMLTRTRRLMPLGIFALLASETTSQALFAWQSTAGTYWRLLAAPLTGWAIYGLVLLPGSFVGFRPGSSHGSFSARWVRRWSRRWQAAPWKARCPWRLTPSGGRAACPTGSLP